MQDAFAFVTSDLSAWRDRLFAATPVSLPATRRKPIGQLVKSLISARTRDAVSLAAYRRLGARYGSVATLAQATPEAVAGVIHDVTFAEAKADHLVAALRRIAHEDGGFVLGHLGDRPLEEALGWLERLPGVARKVSASTLNASTLGRPVLIVDTHVLRVLQRLGFVGPGADYRAASEAVTAARPRWSGDVFLGFHIAMKRLGQTVCRWDVPECEACPLARDCPTARRGRLG
ncbi:endonuclease III [Sphingomonas sp. SUN019]|uniref:endonuclease III domain-containing protein n=1 Tax=Sphingomonas sp. SUN019 TaxID=2937788 RepID=UPI002164C394|nr:endonuclease III [Sphingomonas sp. SUN019]UVO51343.1 endonuclease III [Sphingomonas sp. SUN019]